MDLSGGASTVDPLQRFLEEEIKRLDSDKNTELKKESLKHRHSLSCHEAKSADDFTKHKYSSSHSTIPFNNHTRDKNMVKDGSGGYLVVNSRENEKDKLINILSVPKTRHSYPNIRVSNKFDSASKINCSNFTIDAREKEKDRLAAIFASSGNQFSKVSNQQNSKNLNSEVIFDKNQELYLGDTKTQEWLKENDPLVSFRQNQKNDYHNKNQFRTSEEKSTDSNRQNWDIPKILVSEYKEKPETAAANNQRMVRIGEFSPLNPSHPAGKPTLGVGEYDERRRSLQEQQRQEYNEYLQQMWEDEDAHNPNMARTPRRCSNSPFRGEGQHCTSPAPRLSPLPKCFEGLSEKEIKEHLYREELRKQIEENNRIREELKRKEAEEEAKMDAKIRKEQEEMKRRYEEERLQQLELAIKKKEQEDFLRDKLLVEQQKAVQENKAKKKQILNVKQASPNIVPSRRSMRSSQSTLRSNLLSQSMPAAACASTALHNVHESLRQPLLELEGHLASVKSSKPNSPDRDLSFRNFSALDQHVDTNNRLLGTMSPPIHRTKEVDILVQRVALDPEMQRSVSQQTLRQPLPDTSHDASDTIKEVERMLRQPLLSEPYQVLPPISPPLLHATIPPIMPTSHPSATPPRSPPLPTSKRIERTNADILDDKWKVPYVERYNALPPDVFTKHNSSVLTQLGAFRRHLQQERLRMQQRVLDETP